MSDHPRLTEPLELFYSYSHKDEDLRDELETHLSMLKRQKVIGQWHDRGIPAGQEWGGEIDEHLKGADIILLLVSANFLASDYCYDIELKLAMERHEKGEARVVPVILRPCDWSGAPFGKLQALPKNAKPVTTWANQDEAFTDIAKGIRHAAEDLLARRKQAAPAIDATAEPPNPATTKSPTFQIPRPPIVGFVARRDEQGRDIIGRLEEELAPENNRLVALWGPGGSGKTTLAAEFVRDLSDDFKGRVAWVSALGREDFSLATLLDEVATKLGREDLRKLAPEAKAAQVAALVSEVSTLVVLDNFETISEEEQARCLDFLAQAAACPALITTRSRVNRDDVYNVPLAAMSMEEARDFLQRLAERTRTPSNFDRLDRDDLIRRCEANPLVLQWVVRQIDLAMAPQDVLNDLLQGEGDAAERVFTRSFNLPQLGDDGRAVLLALSLFTPDASREALAEVCGFSNDLRRLNKAIKGLSGLWLVEASEDNERLFLRGLTRELSKSFLSNDSRSEEFRLRYIAHFLRYAVTHRQPTPEDRKLLAEEKDNLLNSIDAAFSLQEWESVILIRSVLNNFFMLHGHWDEAIRSGKQAQVAAEKKGDELNVAIFMGNVGLFHWERAEYKEAKQAYGDALEIFRNKESDRHLAICLHQMGLIAQDEDDLEDAKKLYSESLTIKKKLGDQRGVAYTLGELGNLASSVGDHEEAIRLYDECLKISRDLGDQGSIAKGLNQLGQIARRQGEKEKARRLYLESLEISRRLGDQSGIASTLGNLGMLAELEGDKTEAARLYSESLCIYERLGSPKALTARKMLAKVLE
jgi:tetratricopeptide (TPR) repeat protein